ncbi:zinc finger protein ZFP2-like isoform X2 [Liolophura sinensis]|uniref:zinc finger protein ZFP2-like isoform X2 n=1 Tax=Liolophura sinensis TaxID=3198878 RepID=UPI003158BCD3
MVGCAVFGCRNKSKKDSGVSFFKFPRDAQIRNEWIQRTNRANFSAFHPNAHSRICSDHFTDDCYERRAAHMARFGYSGAQNRLKPDAVPTMFCSKPWEKLCSVANTETGHRVMPEPVMLQSVMGVEVGETNRNRQSKKKATRSRVSKASIMTCLPEKNIAEVKLNQDEMLQEERETMLQYYSRRPEVKFVSSSDQHPELQNSPQCYPCFPMMCQKVPLFTSDGNNCTQPPVLQISSHSPPCSPVTRIKEEPLFTAVENGCDLRPELQNFSQNFSCSSMTCEQETLIITDENGCIIDKFMVTSHSSSSGEDSRDLTQESCRSAQSRENRLCDHEQGHITEKPFKCTRCDYSCSQKCELNKHLRIHTGVKPFKCTRCDYSCSQKCELNKHLRIHTGVKPFKCTRCDYSCSQKCELNKHLRIHTGVKPFKCTRCDYSCSQKCELNKHLRIHTGVKPFKCTRCDYSCSQKCELNKHLRIHTGVKPFKCVWCDYKCIQRGDLTRHIRTHTREKPFKCTWCDYRCSRRTNLWAHLRTHTAKKLFKCAWCEHICFTRANLFLHKRTHTGEKHFKYSLCGCKYTSKTNVSKHVRVHKGKQLFKCTWCDYRCSSKVNLLRHIRTHAREKPFRLSGERNQSGEACVVTSVMKSRVTKSRRAIRS